MVAALTGGPTWLACARTTEVQGYADVPQIREDDSRELGSPHTAAV